MYYAIYKNLRDAAWQCLFDRKIDKLPVDVLKIAEECNVHVIRDSIVNELKPGEDARTYCNGNKWIVIFNDRNSSETSRFAIAHELGHILLGHEKAFAKYSSLEYFTQKPKAEKQADMFALRLLCPACILMELDLHTPEEISTFCRVPTHWAQKRSDRMKELYKRNKFFTNNLEIEIHKNFNIYLSAIKENQRKDPAWHSSKNE